MACNQFHAVFHSSALEKFPWPPQPQAATNVRTTALSRDVPLLILQRYRTLPGNEIRFSTSIVHSLVQADLYSACMRSNRESYKSPHGMNLVYILRNLPTRYRSLGVFQMIRRWRKSIANEAARACCLCALSLETTECNWDAVRWLFSLHSCALCVRLCESTEHG